MSPNLSLLNRVRSEFIEMPGLRLRIDQAQRLWNLDRAICESVLRSLVDAKFLGLVRGRPLREIVDFKTSRTGG